MKLETLIKKAESVSALARLLQVRRQAVQGWKKHGIPADRLAALRELKPEWFPK